ALRNILHQPINRVMGVGGFVHRGGIQRAMQGAGHDVVTFRPVFATDVLVHADVAALYDYLGSIVVAFEDGAKVRTGGVAGLDGGAVRRAREQHGRVMGAFGHNDDRVQAHAIAHGNHDVALDVVEAGGGSLEIRGRLAGEVRILRSFLGGAASDEEQNTEAGY